MCFNKGRGRASQLKNSLIFFSERPHIFGFTFISVKTHGKQDVQFSNEAIILIIREHLENGKH